MRNVLTQFPVLILSAIIPMAAQAAPVAQAAADEIDSQALDPNGFKLMAICIAMLAFLALSLIGGVIFYFIKSKKTKA
jgi:hypothetical protein